MMPTDPSTTPAWESTYGKRFKVVVTPDSARVGGDGSPTVSIVTPANGDAWNWPEADQKVLDAWKENWPSIWNGVSFHKRYQISTGKNMDEQTGNRIERNVKDMINPFNQIFSGVRR
jgi:predicted secreted Zn-dependent protease